MAKTNHTQSPARALAWLLFVSSFLVMVMLAGCKSHGGYKPNVEAENLVAETDKHLVAAIEHLMAGDWAAALKDIQACKESNRKTGLAIYQHDQDTKAAMDEQQAIIDKQKKTLDSPWVKFILWVRAIFYTAMICWFLSMVAAVVVPLIFPVGGLVFSKSLVRALPLMNPAAMLRDKMLASRGLAT